MNSRHHAESGDTTTRDWGRKKFILTNTAYHPTDNCIYLADG